MLRRFHSGTFANFQAAAADGNVGGARELRGSGVRQQRAAFDEEIVYHIPTVANDVVKRQSILKSHFEQKP